MKTEAQNQLASIRNIVREKPNLYDQVTIPLSQAGTDMLIAITGDFLYIAEAPATLIASIKFNDSKHDALPLKKGRKYVMPFVRLFFTVPAGQIGTMTLVIGKDAAFDLSDLGIIDVATIQAPVKQQAANTLDVAGSPLNVGNAAPGTLVHAANASRQSITVIVEGANPVRFGKNGVTFGGGAGAAGGILVGSGQSYTFYHTGEIYGICNAGLNSNVGFEEEYNV